MNDWYLYKGLIQALCDEDAFVLVAFEKEYDNVSCKQMSELLEKWLEIVRHSTSFIQLTE